MYKTNFFVQIFLVRIFDFSKMVIFRLGLVTLLLGIVASSPLQVRQFNLTEFDFMKGLSVHDVKQILKASKAEQVAIINEYIDRFFEGFNGFVVQQGLDPIELPDVGGEFQWTIFSGKMYLRNGGLFGLGTMKRNGDVTLQYNYPNIVIKLPLKFDELKFEYDYAIQFMNIGPEGLADGTVKGCRWIIEVKLDMTTLLAGLQKYDLESLGDVSLQFHGGFLEWMVNLFVSVAIPFVKPVIKLVVEGFIHTGLISVIDGYNGIIEGILQGGGAF